MLKTIPLLAALVFLPACAENLAHLAVDPPNHGLIPPASLNPSDSSLHAAGISRQLRIPVGPPAAVLYVRIIDPPNNVPPRATILVLHGFLASGELMMQEGKDLAAAGFRAVVIDLRGHGKSSGDFITFGVVESADLSQLLTSLEAQNLIAGKIGVLGRSYGAATAIELAGRDPRIAAVVALAPFSSMRAVVPTFGRTFVPALGWRSDADYVQIVDAAGKLANFNPDDASPLIQITHTKAPILLVHGDFDPVVPYSHSVALHAAAPDHSELITLKGAGHPLTWLDLSRDVEQRYLTFFTNHLAPIPAAPNLTRAPSAPSRAQ